MRLALVALMLGNFAIGTAVMLAAGVLNEISAAFGVGPAQAGLLVTAGALVMGVGAPLVAGLVGEVDRRNLLALSLIGMGLAHVACATLTDFQALLLVRSVALIVPALYTAQAAAACRFLAPTHAQGRAIGFVFVGWSLAAVLGVPLCTALAGRFGWSAGFVAVGSISVLSGLLLFKAMPPGVRPPQMSLAQWHAALRSAPIMICILATAMASTAQFVLFTYLAPSFKLAFDATSQDVAVYFAAYGVVGVAGSVAMATIVDRIGAHRAAFVGFAAMGTSFVLWPLVTDLASAIVMSIPWALACFASNSAQQARLAALAPALTAGSVALNSAAMYGGQAAGSALGGWLIAIGWIDRLHLTAAAGIVLALWVSQRASRSAANSGATR